MSGFFTSTQSSGLPDGGSGQAVEWREADVWYRANLIGTNTGPTSYPTGGEPTNSAPTSADGVAGDYYMYTPSGGYAILYGPKAADGTWPLIGRSAGSISTGPHAGIPEGYTPGGVYSLDLGSGPTQPYQPTDVEPLYNYKTQVGLIDAIGEYYGRVLWVYNTVAGWYTSTDFSSLTDNDDVVIAGPNIGDALVWDGNLWTNGATGAAFNPEPVAWENYSWVTLISGAGAPTAADGSDGWFYLDTTSGSEELYGPATFNPALLPTGVWDWGSPLANFTFSATGPTDEAGDWYVWDENGDGSVYTLFQKKTAKNYGDMLFWNDYNWEVRSRKFDANDVYVDLTNIDPTYGVDSVRIALSNLFTNKADKFVVFNDQTGTTYTLDSSDYGKMVTLDNASAITLTVPADVFVPGDVVGLLQKGAGTVSVVGDTGVTVNTAATLDLAGQWAIASLLCLSDNEFLLTGNLVLP